MHLLSSKDCKRHVEFLRSSGRHNSRTASIVPFLMMALATQFLVFAEPMNSGVHRSLIRPWTRKSPHPNNK